MEIRVWLERTEPPEGHVGLAGDLPLGGQHRQSVAFVGWLGLMKALYEVLGYSEGQRPLPE